MESNDDLNHPQTPSVSPAPTFKKKKKPLSPLALVLLLSTAFFVIFMIVSGALFMARTPTRGGGSAAALFGAGSVGILEVEGVIMDSKKTLETIEDFENDNDIKAVVVRLNSPGGAVAPSQEIYEALLKMKKPVVSSMSSVAASGAYYIACGTSKIFANPGTITGSIGVIMEFANLEKLYEWAKIRRYTVKTGKFKDIGAEYREMEPEDRAIIQGMIDDVLLQFKTAVAKGRKLRLDDLSKLADGRIFSGSQAKNVKLVDELGTLDDAVMFAGELGGIKGKPRTTYAKEPRPRLWELLLQDGMGDGESSSKSKRGLLSSLLQELTGVESRPAILPAGIYWLWSGSH